MLFPLPAISSRTKNVSTKLEILNASSVNDLIDQSCVGLTREIYGVSRSEVHSYLV